MPVSYHPAAQRHALPAQARKFIAPGFAVARHKIERVAAHAHLQDFALVPKLLFQRVLWDRHSCLSVFFFICKDDRQECLSYSHCYRRPCLRTFIRLQQVPAPQHLRPRHFVRVIVYFIAYFIKGSALDQRSDLIAFHWHAPQKIFERLKRAAFSSCPQNGRDCFDLQPSYLHQAYAHRAFSIRAVLRRVLHPRMIYRRQPHRDPPALGFFHIRRHVIKPRSRAAHRRQKFRRVVRFQIRHAIRNVRIRRRVRFAKTEPREFFHHHPGFLALLLPMSVPSSCAIVRAWPATRSETLPSFARRQSHRVLQDRFPVWRQNQSRVPLDTASIHPAQRCSSPEPPLLPLPSELPSSRCCPAPATSS